MRGIIVDRSSSVPLHRQLENALRDAVLGERLRPGEKLLSIRDLQTHLGLSRNTIVTALGQLQAEGYLTFVRGVGTFVADGLTFKRRNEHLTRKPSASTSRAGSRFMAVHELAANLIATGPFRPSFPALDAFPIAQFRRALNAVDWSGPALDYPAPLGDLELRRQIVRRLEQTRGIACTPEQVVITGGAQAAFSLIAHVLLQPQDRVIVEEPGYRSVRAVLLAHGARIAGVPVDAQGIQVAKMPKARASLAYVTPSTQYPTGVALSLERRLALLHWAQKNDCWIVEDDYGSEFNYTGKPQPALHGLDGGRRVLYVGTFSKVLTPALRLAYVIVPQPLVAAFCAAQEVTGSQPSPVIQRAVANFMSSGQLARHVTKMRRLCDERRQFVSAEFSRAIGTSADVRDFATGLHFVVGLPHTIQDAPLSVRAAQAGVTLRPLSAYFHGAPTDNGIVVGYAVAPVSVAKRAIATVAGLL
jgi:GntR family transcriptional regulator/MocR family aminotransferase